MEEFKNIFLKILKIIEYSENREVFTQQFLDICSKQTILELVNQLPLDKQTQLNTQLSTIKSLKEVGEVIEKYFSHEVFLRAFTKSFTENVKDYLSSISSSFTQSQLEILQRTFPTQQI